MTSDAENVERLSQIVRLFSARQWCLAASGDFSLRSRNGNCLITESGLDKSRLTPDDFLMCDLHGRPVDTARKPSAKTGLHCALYRLDNNIGAVMHTNSATSTVLSRTADSDLYFEHYEMQKAFDGIESHIGGLGLVILENSQEIPSIVEELKQRWNGGDISAPGFLIRGHGLYAWGSSMDDAQRHVEGLEFLMTCAWQEMIAKK
ncbi:MAG: methylthioribulose 1-phosphate dehydratase [Gammaproteobacteria bacterium]|nr:methylthioribulose 1-phosphate dehydratase [Gammaproteobacteria bacterium]